MKSYTNITHTKDRLAREIETVHALLTAALKDAHTDIAGDKLYISTMYKLLYIVRKELSQLTELLEVEEGRFAILDEQWKEEVFGEQVLLTHSEQNAFLVSGRKINTVVKE